MWPFRMRADLEPEKTETASNEDALLRASLSDDYMTKDQAMNVPAFAACVNKIAETVSTIPIRLYKLVDGKLEEVKDDERPRLLNDDTLDTLDGVQFKRALVKDYLGRKFWCDRLPACRHGGRRFCARHVHDCGAAHLLHCPCLCLLCHSGMRPYRG